MHKLGVHVVKSHAEIPQHRTANMSIRPVPMAVRPTSVKSIQYSTVSAWQQSNHKSMEVTSSSLSFVTSTVMATNTTTVSANVSCSVAVPRFPYHMVTIVYISYICHSSAEIPL